MKTYQEPARNIPIARDADVIVAGGGPAGLAARVGLSPCGLDVRALQAALVAQGAELRQRRGQCCG